MNDYSNYRSVNISASVEALVFYFSDALRKLRTDSYESSIIAWIFGATQHADARWFRTDRYPERA